MKKSIASGAKRGSVGTLILEALSTSDKYGWEIMKAIEEKSNGEFILKEPSLYSSLKRMETYGLITSYWQDSDIGGRRHYYNLTQLGKEKLNNSSISWSEEKQFVNELFTDANGNIKPITSTVDTSIEELNKSVQKVQQTVKKIAQNEKDIQKFITETEKQEEVYVKEEAKKPIIEQPIKTGNGIIFPTVNPLQQDIFSVLTMVPQEPANEKAIVTERTEEKLVDTIKENIKEEKIEEKPTTFHSFEEQPISSENTTKITAQDETIKPVVEPVKKEKYASTPITYVQMPMFEHEKGINLSGIHIEKEQPEREKVTSNTTKPNSIQYLRNLATEKDFLDLKNSFKNKHKSFLNKTINYQPNFNYKTDTNLEDSDSLYGAFDLHKEEDAPNSLKTFKFNNLGLEETKKAREDAISKIDKEETATLSSPLETKDTPISSLNKVAPVNTDNIDYKSIMGDLFVDDEKEETPLPSSIKDLPRINVSDNVNVSLKAKKQVDETKVVEEKPVYSYSFDQFDNKPITNETETKTEYEPMIKPHTELKNFHENLSHDDYSSNLLDDIYLKNIKVRIHKTEQKTPFLATNYVSINKLNANLSFAVFILMLIQIVCTYIGLSNANFINITANFVFIGAGVLSCIPFLIFSIIYLFFPLRKKEVNYSLTSKLANNFIVLLIAFVFIYAVNLFMGMNSLNTMDFITTWLLPAILSINLLLVPIIKFILLKRKKYYL